GAAGIVEDPTFGCQAPGVVATVKDNPAPFKDPATSAIVPYFRPTASSIVSGDTPKSSARTPTNSTNPIESTASPSRVPESPVSGTPKFLCTWRNRFNKCVII